MDKSGEIIERRRHFGRVAWGFAPPELTPRRKKSSEAVGGGIERGGISVEPPFRPPGGRRRAGGTEPPPAHQVREVATTAASRWLFPPRR